MLVDRNSVVRGTIHRWTARTGFYAFARGCGPEVLGGQVQIFVHLEIWSGQPTKLFGFDKNLSHGFVYTGLTIRVMKPRVETPRGACQDVPSFAQRMPIDPK
jgi:hypothetical protein